MPGVKFLLSTPESSLKEVLLYISPRGVCQKGCCLKISIIVVLMTSSMELYFQINTNQIQCQLNHLHAVCFSIKKEQHLVNGLFEYEIHVAFSLSFPTFAYDSCKLGVNDE